MLKENIQQGKMSPEGEYSEQTRRNVKQLLTDVFIPRLEQVSQKPLGFPAAAYKALVASEYIAKRVEKQRERALEFCQTAKAIAGDFADDIEIPEIPQGQRWGFSSVGSPATTEAFEQKLVVAEQLSKGAEGIERSISEENQARTKVLVEKQGKFLELVGLGTWDEAYSEGDITDVPRDDIREGTIEHTLTVGGHSITWVTDGYEIFDTEIDKVA